MGILKKIFGFAMYKTSTINTYNSFSSSSDNIEHHRICEFLHKRYEDGNHEIEVDIKGGNSMRFKLLSLPVSMGEGIMMYELASEDGSTVGIDLMMMGKTAYIKFPDDTMLNFRK